MIATTHIMKSLGPICFWTNFLTPLQVSFVGEHVHHNESSSETPSAEQSSLNLIVRHVHGIAPGTIKLDAVEPSSYLKGPVPLIIHVMDCVPQGPNVLAARSGDPPGEYVSLGGARLQLQIFKAGIRPGGGASPLTLLVMP